MIVRDLVTVEQELGFSYEMGAGSAEHYQQVCPKCRRALFGLAQGQMWVEFRNKQLTGVTKRDVD
jgi:hypothetical protein